MKLKFQKATEFQVYIDHMVMLLSVTYLTYEGNIFRLKTCVSSFFVFVKPIHGVVRVVIEVWITALPHRVQTKLRLGVSYP